MFLSPACNDHEDQNHHQVTMPRILCLYWHWDREQQINKAKAESVTGDYIDELWSDRVSYHETYFRKASL